MIFPSSNKIGSTAVARTLSETKPAQEDKSVLSAAFKKRGNEFLENGELANAEECYRKAIDINPGYAEAHLNLGFVLKEQKLYDDSCQSLKQAILINPALEDAYYLLATVSQELGKLEESIGNYNKAIELKPDFEFAYRDLSQVLLQSGLVENAKAVLLEAIPLFPNSVDFHFNLGNLYAHEGESDKAIDCFAKALLVQPDFTAGHINLGLALETQGKLDAAIRSFQSAVSIEPTHAEAHAGLGFALQKQGQLEGAIASYLNALAINTNLAAVHNNLASALQAQDKLGEAIKHLRHAVAINPNYVEAHSNLGVAFEIEGNFEAAVESCLTAISIDPNYAEAHSNLANAYRAIGKYEVAAESCLRALALNPHRAETHFNLANIYKAVERVEAAIDQYQIAITLNPEYASAHYNLGATFLDIGQWHQAILCYEKATSLKPDFVEAHLNLSLCRLLLGNFETGWAEYEWRWRSTHMKMVRHHFTPPIWLGKDSLHGKTILLHHEQGFGDTLQFCRYAKLVAARGATVLLLVPPALKSLLAGLDGVAQVMAEGEALPSFDYHCPLMSLPFAFSTRINNIPSESFYIRPDQAHSNKWQTKLGKKEQLRVGLVWCGSKDHKNDHNRSISLSELLRHMPDQVQLVSLQKEIREDDRAILSERDKIDHFGSDLQSFMDTAGLIANVDIVISVDTAVAHLAGAMGKPTWILLPFSPDWRWMLERRDCPWYPSAKLFRQPKIGEWESVLVELSDELRNFISSQV